MLTHNYMLKALGIGLILAVLAGVTVAADLSGVRARAFVVAEIDGTVLLERNSTAVRPIASITKLLVAEQLASRVDPAALVKISNADLVSTRAHMSPGDQVSQHQLLVASLVASNNAAIHALARHHDMPSIITATNNAAAERGLSTIHVEEPTGLSSANRASAADLVRWIALVYTSKFAQLSTEPTAELPRALALSTNPLLRQPGWNFSLSKTGWTWPAGGCLVAVVDMGARPVIVVILGSTSVASRWQDLMILRRAISADQFFTGPISRPVHHSHHKKSRRPA